MQNDFSTDYSAKAFVEFCRLVADWDSQKLEEMPQKGARTERSGGVNPAVREFWKDIRFVVVLVITNKEFAS